MKRVLIAIAVFLLLSGFVHAGSVPQYINYQGKLTNPAGIPIHGIKTLEFSIYDAAVGGDLEWGPQAFSSVPVEQGYFNVILSVDTGGKAVTDAFGPAPDSNQRYFEITVDTETIAPRQQILSAPYAVQTLYALHGDPVGSIQMYFGVAAPAGWLICDGGVIDKITHPEYAALVDHLRDPGKVGSSAYQGAAATEAVLPDLRGRTSVGAGTGNGLTTRTFGTEGGEEAHVLNSSQMPTHNHGTSVAHNGFPDGSSDRINYYYLMWPNRGAEVSIDTSDAGANAAHNNMQPFFVVNYIIKY